MIKKYFPLIILVAAGGLLFYVKMHQRGTTPDKPKTTHSDEQITVPAVTPPSDNPNREEGFNRRTSISSIQNTPAAVWSAGILMKVK